MGTKNGNQWRKAPDARTSTDRRGMESPEAAVYGRFPGDAALRLYTYTGTLSRSPLHQASAQTGYNAPEPLLKVEGGRFREACKEDRNGPLFWLSKYLAWVSVIRFSKLRRRILK